MNVMTPNGLQAPQGHPICIGTGLLALDLIYGKTDPHLLARLAGGSCGNVLSILSFLGWQSYPVARLGDDSAAESILEDLSRFGVKNDFIELDPSISTPVIIERLHEDSFGQISHSFDTTCPRCHQSLPRYSPVQITSIYQAWNSLADANVFYFDRLSPSSLHLASKARDNGLMVVFEPSSVRNQESFLKAANIAHILKFSRERFEGKEILIAKAMSDLVVETRGKEGLRYRLGPVMGTQGIWKYMPSFPVRKVRDAAGAGDWCTAGMIYCLADRKIGVGKIFSQEMVETALAFGQALSATNCQFTGARGTMYHVPSDEVVSMAKGVVSGKLIVHIPEHQSFKGLAQASGDKCLKC